MANKKTGDIEIGGRLFNTATGNIVAGADAIKDEAQDKTQAEINVETYEHVADIDAALQELSPDQTEALALATDVNTLKAKSVRSDEAQSLTAEEKALALSNLGISGIDDEPTVDSNNIVKSGGVKTYVDKFVEEKDNQKYVSVLIDKAGKLIKGIKDNGDTDVFVKHTFHSGIECPELDELDKRIVFQEGLTFEETNMSSFPKVDVDSSYKIHHIVKRDGTHLFPFKIESPTIDVINESLANKADKSEIPSDEHIRAIASVGDPKSGSLKVTAQTLGVGSTLEITNSPNLKSNHSVTFNANLGTMGKIKISHGEINYRTAKIEIDDTYLYTYKWKTGELLSTTPHGLTFVDFIIINIATDSPDNKANVTITTNGGTYTQEVQWCGSYSNVKVVSTDAVLNDCVLTIGGFGLFQDIWLFMDSYGDLIPEALNSLGYNNYMLDAYSGRDSEEGYASLLSDLQIGKPKILLWMLGGNDPDSNNAINPSYKTILDTLIAKCREVGVYLIVSTIPNMPERVNKHKNDYIRQSGVSYVDIAKAVGADYVGSSWYNGLLQVDNVHPTLYGAEIIAKVVANEVPVIQC